MLKGHEIANVFPLLTGDELKALGKDIAENGIRNPIVLFEGKILDGRNRYRAARQVRVEPLAENYIDFDGDWDAAVRFVASENLARRHMDRDQCAMCAAKLANLRRGNPAAAKASSEALTQREAAEMLGVSRSAVQRARQVIVKGAPELTAAVEEGKVGVSVAAEVAQLPPEQQREVVKAGPEKVRETARDLRSRPAAQRRTLEQDDETRRARSGARALTSLAVADRHLTGVVSILASGEADLNDDQRTAVFALLRRLNAGVLWIERLNTGTPHDVHERETWLKEGRT